MRAGIALPRQFGQTLALCLVQIGPAPRGRFPVTAAEEERRGVQPPKAPRREAATAAAAQSRAEIVQHGPDLDLRLGHHLGQRFGEKARVFTALVTCAHLARSHDQGAKAWLRRWQGRGGLLRGGVAVVEQNKPYLPRLARRAQERRQGHPLAPQRRGWGQGRINRDQIALPTGGNTAARVVNQGDIRCFGLKGKVGKRLFERRALSVDQRGDVEALPLQRLREPRRIRARAVERGGILIGGDADDHRHTVLRRCGEGQKQHQQKRGQTHMAGSFRSASVGQRRPLTYAGRKRFPPS